MPAQDDGGHRHGALATERARRHRAPLALLAAAMGIIAAVEAVGGWITGSLALLADAAHALTDTLAVGLSLLAVSVVSRAAESATKSFGYYRAEILAAFANAVFLGVLAVFIVIEAVERLLSPEPVQGGAAAVIAILILGVEAMGLVALRNVQGESLNARSAFLHLLGDVMSTIGVAGAGALIHFGGTGFLWVDATVSIAIALLLGFWALRLLQDTGHILMEGTPPELDPERIRRAALEVGGVQGVHDLHVWSLTSGLHSMSAHVVADHCDPNPELVRRLRERMHRDFDLGHVTIQLEDPCNPCGEAHF